MTAARLLLIASLVVIPAFAQPEIPAERRIARPRLTPLTRAGTRPYLRPAVSVASEENSTLVAALHDHRPLPILGDILCHPVHFPVPSYVTQNLNQIKVRALRNQLTWYFMAYLPDHPNPNLTRRYFPAGLPEFNSLPPDAPPPPSPNQNPPLPRHIPGEQPGQDGLHDQQFSLASIECSDRFGGTMNLRFIADESLEYDVRKGNRIWDLQETQLEVYVTPRHHILNTTQKAGGESVYVEFDYGHVAAYDLVTQNNLTRIEPAASDHAAELETIFREVATSVSQTNASEFRNFRDSASAFSYGLIHEAFLDRLPGGDVVAMMELGEDHLDLTTRAGVPAIYVAARITDIDFFIEDDDEDENYDVLLSACWEMNGPCTDRRIRNLSDDDWTAFYQLFSVPLSSCPPNVGRHVSIALRSAVGTDHFQSPIAFLDVNCSALHADAALFQWGSSTVFVDNLRGVDDDNIRRAQARVEVRLTLEIR